MFTLGSNIVGVDFDHPDNAGLACLLAGLPPADGGRQLYDLTGRTAGATLAGGATWSGTPFGQQGLSLAGSQYADAGTLPNAFAAGVTVAAWVNAAAAQTGSNFYTVVSARNGADNSTPFSLDVNKGGGKYRFYCNNGGFNVWEGGTPVAGVWQRVVVAYAPGGPPAVTVNGVPQAVAQTSGGSSPAVLYTANPLRVGGFFNSSGADLTWLGQLADVRVYGRGVAPGSAARDYEWSQDPTRDPRLRRLSTRSLFVTAAGTPASSFVPAFAPGWGW